jgi:hypothetical protein
MIVGRANEIQAQWMLECSVCLLGRCMKFKFSSLDRLFVVCLVGVGIWESKMKCKWTMKVVLSLFMNILFQKKKDKNFRTWEFTCFSFIYTFFSLMFLFGRIYSVVTTLSFKF